MFNEDRIKKLHKDFLKAKDSLGRARANRDKRACLAIHRMMCLIHEKLVQLGA